MLQPNDLPIVCLPTGLSDEAAAEVLEFLHELTAAFERHYTGQLIRHRQYQQQLDLKTANDEPF